MNESRYYFLENDLCAEELKGKVPIYIIDPFGSVYVVAYICADDVQMFNQDNVFLTREDAEREAKRRKIHQELKELAPLLSLWY